MTNEVILEVLKGIELLPMVKGIRGTGKTNERTNTVGTGEWVDRRLEGQTNISNKHQTNSRLGRTVQHQQRWIADFLYHCSMSCHWCEGEGSVGGGGGCRKLKLKVRVLRSLIRLVSRGSPNSHFLPNRDRIVEDRGKKREGGRTLMERFTIRLCEQVLETNTGSMSLERQK